jgi:hypothetical protein
MFPVEWIMSASWFDYVIKRFVAAGSTMISGPSEMLGLENGYGNACC